MPHPSPDHMNDAWLIAALLPQDMNDRETAAAHILATHEPQLRAYMRKKLPIAWADEALSETWKGFLTAIERQGVRTSIGQLLDGITEHKRADAVDKRTHERRIEADLPTRCGARLTLQVMLKRWRLPVFWRDCLTAVQF